MYEMCKHGTTLNMPGVTPSLICAPTWARNDTSTLIIQILKKPNNSPTAGHCAHCLPAYAAGVANGDERAVRHVHAMVATDLESKFHRNFGNRLQLLADTSATRYVLPDLIGWGMDIWLMDVLPLWDQKWSPYWRFLFVPRVVVPNYELLPLISR